MRIPRGIWEVCKLSMMIMLFAYGVDDSDESLCVSFKC